MHPADDDDCVLRLEDVTKVYSGIIAVRHANLSLRRGAGMCSSGKTVPASRP